MSTIARYGLLSRWSRHPARRWRHDQARVDTLGAIERSGRLVLGRAVTGATTETQADRLRGGEALIRRPAWRRVSGRALLRIWPPPCVPEVAGCRTQNHAEQRQAALEGRWRGARAG
jgi:hypothetical protein